MRWKRITRSVNNRKKFFSLTPSARENFFFFFFSLQKQNFTVDISLKKGKNLSALWSRNQETIVDRIRNQWKLLDEFSEEEIHTICGILEVNCFEVGGHNGTSARALYPEAYLMCHDCVPNTNHTDDPITHELTVRTTKPMKKGEVISLSYAYILQVIIFSRCCSCWHSIVNLLTFF